MNVNWNDNAKILVTCVDGSTYSADHVVFTASLGVLKDRHEALFMPKLTDRKIKAINNIGFGTLGKVFLEFEEPFWLSKKSDFSRYIFLWEDEDTKQVEGTDKSWLVFSETFSLSLEIIYKL